MSHRALSQRYLGILFKFLVAVPTARQLQDKAINFRKFAWLPFSAEGSQTGLEWLLSLEKVVISLSLNLQLLLYFLSEKGLVN